MRLPRLFKTNKKFIMLTDVNTKEFWEQVKEEYQPSGRDYGICESSTTFCAMWNDKESGFYQRPDRKVMEFADDFLKKVGRDDGLVWVSPGYLFVDRVMDADKIQIRRDFLDYMINKFS